MQTKLQGLTLKEGRHYTLTFRAKADKTANDAASVGKDMADWHNMGLTEDDQTDRAASRVHVQLHGRGDRRRSTRGSRLHASAGQPGRSGSRICSSPPAPRAWGCGPASRLTAGIAFPAPPPSASGPTGSTSSSTPNAAYSDQMRAVLKDELKIKANMAAHADRLRRHHRAESRSADGVHRLPRLLAAPQLPQADWSPTNWKIAEHAAGRRHGRSRVRRTGRTSR